MSFSQYRFERALASLHLDSRINTHLDTQTDHIYKTAHFFIPTHSFHSTQTFLFISLLWYLLCYCLRVYLNTFVCCTNRRSSFLLIEDDGADKCDSILCTENCTNIRKYEEHNAFKWIVVYTLNDRNQYDWYIFKLDLMFVVCFSWAVLVSKCFCCSPFWFLHDRMRIPCNRLVQVTVFRKISLVLININCKVLKLNLYLPWISLKIQSAIGEFSICAGTFRFADHVNWTLSSYLRCS